MAQVETDVTGAPRPLPEPGPAPQKRQLTTTPVRRIGYLLDGFPLASHDFVRQEIVELQRRGIQVRIFSLGRPEGRLDDMTSALAGLQGPVIYFQADVPDENANGRQPSASELRSAQVAWIANQVASAHIQHLHAHLTTAAGEVLPEVKQLTGIPYSFTAHSEGLFESADYRTLRQRIDEAKFVVTLSESDRGHLLRVCGAEVGPKIRAIHMGVDLDEYRFAAAESHDSDSVLAVGPLVEKSGFADLIDAMAMLRDRGHSVRLTIVGDGELKQDLIAQVECLRLTDRVKFLGGASRRELAILMRVHTTMALPWLADQRDRDVLANLVLESMAVGLVVIATDLPGLREMVDDGMNGRLIMPRDPLWLAGALETLLENPKLRARMAIQARAKVERRFDAARNTSQLARLFNDMLGDEHHVNGADVAGI